MIFQKTVQYFILKFSGIKARIANLLKSVRTVRAKTMHHAAITFYSGFCVNVYLGPRVPRATIQQSSPVQPQPFYKTTQLRT